MAVSPRTPPRYRLPFLCRAWPLRLPDCLSSGARPAQDTRWPPVANLVMPAPVSATASSAERRPRPGIDPAWARRAARDADRRGRHLLQSGAYDGAYDDLITPARRRRGGEVAGCPGRHAFVAVGRLAGWQADE